MPVVHWILQQCKICLRAEPRLSLCTEPRLSLGLFATMPLPRSLARPQSVARAFCKGSLPQWPGRIHRFPVSDHRGERWFDAQHGTCGLCQCLVKLACLCRMVFTLLWLNISTFPVTDKVCVTQWLWVQTKNMPPDLKPEQTQDCLFV